MKPTLLLVVGPPASGKTTLVKALTDTLSYSIEKKPFWHTIYYDRSGYPIAMQLGWNPEFGPGAEFGGTDRLAFDVIPKAVQLLKGNSQLDVIVEGDRLAVPRLIDSAMAHGYDVEVLHVNTPQETLERRWGNRTQDRSWAAGRISKVEGLLHEYRPWVLELDGILPIENLLFEAIAKSKVASRLMRGKDDDTATAGVPSPYKDPAGGTGAEAREDSHGG